ncbi:MAG: hypothetical protein LV480_04475 [Methylacidiphilales bacterium]|nr:hypothetical protein [Candidatus Methylacidiphilales bacterium]
MQKSLAILILAVFTGACPAQDVSSQGLPSWNSDSEKAWWAKNPTPDLWPQAAQSLLAQLEAGYKQNGARAFSDSDFQSWLEHYEWIRLGLDCPEVIANPDDLKAFVALGQDETVSHLFVEKLNPLDVKKEALKNLLRLDEANADDLHEYAALGVAYSLVFDQPFPRGWPHRQVNQAAVPIGDLDIVQRFHFYVQANRDKKLDRDLTQLSFENLKFLVDSEVSLSELEYAQKNRNNIPYGNFGDAFFAIKYDNARLGNSSSVYIWPFPSYKLADIEKNGGICIDQAYYAETLGKGRGIPTIRFTGFGMEGAHAWFGYLSNSGMWELDCGRYENQDFPKGFAVDPQTWQPIDDSVLDNFFKKGAKDSNYQPEMNALAWARLHTNDPSYAQILDDAHSIMPAWSATWRLQAALVGKAGDLDKEKQFYQDWITQFGDYTEMKVEGQKRLYLVLKAANDPDADDLLKDIIKQNRSEGFDLGIQADADAINEKLKNDDWDGARLAYESAIRDFGQEGGLTLYSKIVYPYVETCLKSDKVDLADRAITFTKDRMTIDLQSQLGQDFTDLKQEVEARKLGAR